MGRHLYIIFLFISAVVSAQKTDKPNVIVKSVGPKFQLVDLKTNLPVNKQLWDEVDPFINDFGRVFHPEDQIEGPFMEMEGISDKLHVDMSIQETETRNTWLPVVKRTHGVEEMRDAPGPLSVSLLGFTHRGVCVAHAARHSFVGQ